MQRRGRPAKDTGLHDSEREVRIVVRIQAENLNINRHNPCFHPKTCETDILTVRSFGQNWQIQVMGAAEEVLEGD